MDEWLSGMWVFETYLDGDLEVVEVDDRDVAELLCLGRAIVTGSGFLGEHVHCGAFEF